MSRPGSDPTYAARMTPLRPQTVWTLRADALVETSGARTKSLPLADLRAIRLAGAAGTRSRAAHLTFRRGRMVIPAQSLAGGARLEDRSAAFDVFLAALERASGVSPSGAVGPALSAASLSASSLRAGLAWAIGLTAAGALLMMLAALMSGLPDLGLALGARLLFAAILLSAALPWLDRDKRA